MDIAKGRGYHNPLVLLSFSPEMLLIPCVASVGRASEGGDAKGACVHNRAVISRILSVPMPMYYRIASCPSQ
ncbi:unnamed protein product [Peniophora sp. CBMAI 1063]|nr:unnamed protein product [Peniophora sp. CBMAI 1063]